MSEGRSRGAAAEGGRAEAEDEEGAACDDEGVADEVAGDLGMVEDLVHAVDGVRHGQGVGDRFEGGGHPVARGEESAEQQLGEDHGRHELDGLELGGGEGGDEEAEGGAEEGVEKGDQEEEPGGADDVEAEEPDGEAGGEGGLDDGEEAEGEGVAA